MVGGEGTRRWTTKTQAGPLAAQVSVGTMSCSAVNDERQSRVIAYAVGRAGAGMPRRDVRTESSRRSG